MDVAVEAHLYGRLAEIAAEPVAPGESAQEWTAELDALEAVGLVEAEERTKWEARLDEAMALRGQPPSPSPEVLERARRYLQERVGKRERRFSWRSPDPEDVAAEVIALRAAGALDDAEESRWLDRIAAADGDDRLRLGELRAVVAPASPPAENVTVTSVELWSEAVVVRFACDESRWGSGELKLGDDAATEYEGVAGAFDLRGGRRGYQIFVPTAPAAARTMHVHHGDATVDVPLTS